MALLTPRLQTAGLQDGEGTHFSCLKPPGCWSFVTTAPGHERGTYRARLQTLFTALNGAEEPLSHTWKLLAVGL